MAKIGLLELHDDGVACRSNIGRVNLVGGDLKGASSVGGALGYGVGARKYVKENAVFGGDGEHRAVQFSTAGIANGDGPAGNTDFPGTGITETICIEIHELVDSQASYGLTANFKIIHFGSRGDKAVEAAIATGIIDIAGVANKIAGGRDPYLVNPAVVRSIVEGAELDGEATTAARIREDRVVEGRSEKAARHGHLPVSNGIGAEQGFAAWVSYLKVVSPVRKPCGCLRSIGAWTPVKINARGTAFGTVQILVDPGSGDVRGKNGS